MQQPPHQRSLPLWTSNPGKGKLEQTSGSESVPTRSLRRQQQQQHVHLLPADGQQAHVSDQLPQVQYAEYGSQQQGIHPQQASTGNVTILAVCPRQSPASRLLVSILAHSTLASWQFMFAPASCHHPCQDQPCIVHVGQQAADIPKSTRNCKGV